jgi:hypothetical protein
MTIRNTGFWITTNGTGTINEQRIEAQHLISVPNGMPFHYFDEQLDADRWWISLIIGPTNFQMICYGSEDDSPVKIIFDEDFDCVTPETLATFAMTILQFAGDVNS